jgi:hypothetical protein
VGQVTSDLQRRAARRRQAAMGILQDLGLIARWAAHGTVHLVGSVALGLVVEPDIDLEIYSAAPDIGKGFTVLAPLAAFPGMRRARFTNTLGTADPGLYFQLQYEQGDQTWKIDMWYLAEDYPGPRGCELTGPLLSVLTPVTRDRILAIKEAARERGEQVQGIRVYQAVLDGGITDYAGFQAWTASTPGGLSHWSPKLPDGIGQHPGSRLPNDRPQTAT